MLERRVLHVYSRPTVGQRRGGETQNQRTDMILEDPIAPGVHKLPCGDKYIIRWLPAPKGGSKNCVYIFNCVPEGDSVFDANPTAITAMLHSFGVGVFEYQIYGIEAYYTCWYAMIESMSCFDKHSIFWISHGTDGGVVIPQITPPDTNMGWGDFACMMQEIPSEYREKILLCLCSCEGMNLEGIGFFNNMPLYENLIGSYNVIQVSDAMIGFSVVYYNHFVDNQPPVELVKRANCSIGKELFRNQHGPLQSYINKYLSSKGLSVSPFVEKYINWARSLGK